MAKEYINVYLEKRLNSLRPTFLVKHTSYLFERFDEINISINPELKKSILLLIDNVTILYRNNPDVQTKCQSHFAKIILYAQRHNIEIFGK
jgi:hypothetical protein